MEDKFFDLEIITPFKIIYQEKVKHIRMPGTEGYFGIMANHAPFITSLKIGEIKIDLESVTKYFATSGGIVEVLPKKTSILVETAEEAAQIDVERAIYAKERAQRRLAEKVPGTDIERAKDAWYRAINRLKVSKKATKSS
ncbi:MAG: F0F1 ATP synthase subunit epsilon [bacterium]|nr:MAG: F0F1 ATP synthase subunit epsilon [bacterium]